MSALALEQQRVLLLNKNYMPIGIRSLKKAINMLFGTKAIIIDPSDYTRYTWDDWSKLKPVDDKIIHSARQTFRAPTIILLHNYGDLPQFKHEVRFSRRTLFKRDGYKCIYCGCKPGLSSLSVDHILPKSKGGKTNWENCGTSCYICNSKKSNRTLSEAGMKLLWKPRKPTFTLGEFERKVYLKDWEAFISELYMSVELENDM